MNAIEELMEMLGDAAERGVPAERMQWSLSCEGLTRIKAAVTPRLDPFFKDDTLLGLPYIVKGAQQENFILQEKSDERRLQGC